MRLAWEVSYAVLYVLCRCVYLFITLSCHMCVLLHADPSAAGAAFKPVMSEQVFLLFVLHHLLVLNPCSSLQLCVCVRSIQHLFTENAVWIHLTAALDSVSRGPPNVHGRVHKHCDKEGKKEFQPFMTWHACPSLS